MKIHLQNTDISCNAAEGDTILLACARCGVILSAPCGGRRRCGKCTVRLIEGEITGDAPDSDGNIRACAAVPLTDITIACPGAFFDGAAEAPPP
ncbi:MAG: 2Fe-2S iron-sulfur cluster-binding protein, partial [Treponema sp.]|nr:2Fe-2S iron-sulfur cluster-binding protein [Treponema sp.]